MTRSSQIFRWLKQVKADHRLRPIDFTVAYQLSERTNEAEFTRSGTLLTWQGIALLAAEAGVCERTVRRSIRRLQKFKHLAIKPGGGRHHSNRYTLLLHPTQAVAVIDDNTEILTAVSGFSGNGDSGVRVSSETVTPLSRNPDSRVQKPGHQCPPNSYRTTDRTLATVSETDDRGPRQRAVALGPLDPAPETSKRLGNGAALAAEGEPTKPSRPHTDLENKIRSALGDRSKLFAGARVLEADDTSVLIECLTDFLCGELRRFEPDIRTVVEARQIRFTVAHGPGLKKRGGGP